MAFELRGGWLDWVDRHAVDRHGEVIGVVVDVYDDPVTGRPTWLVLSTGFFGIRRTVAPLRGAVLLGASVVVAYSKEVIVAAPPVHTFTAITAADEQSIVAHYARHGNPPTGNDPGRQQP